MSAFSSLIVQRFGRYGTLTDSQLSALERHYTLLLKWNQKINLTRITTLEDAVEMHYCESLYVARFLPVQRIRIADIGSGAGFPGIPLAIRRPDCSFDLIEADQRKAVFLREAGRELGNVRVVAKRAADVSERYELGVSRAVAAEYVLGSGVSERYLILGSEGEKLPWGENRRVRLVEVPRET